MSSIYYSALAQNASTSSVSAPVPCSITEVRSQPIIPRCDKYKLAIVRFSTPAKCLPVYQLQAQTGQADPNKLVYNVALQMTANIAFPAFPQDIGDGFAQMVLTLWAEGAIFARAPFAFGAQTLRNATETAAMVQATIQNVGGLWATTACVADTIGRLQLTPPTGYEIAIQSVSGPDNDAAIRLFGFIPSQWNQTSVKLTALNACNLGAVQTFTGTSTQQLIWVPEDAAAPTPQPPLVQQDLSSAYYWGWSLQHAATLWNTAYAAAIADLQSQFLSWWYSLDPTSVSGVLQSKAPYITFDPATSLFSMNADPWSSPSNATSSSAGLLSPRFATSASAGLLYPRFEEAMTVCMDEESDALFGSWNEVTPAGSLGTALYASLDFTTANLVAGTCVLTQDSSSLTGNWSPCTSILITSDQIPVLGEQLSSPFVSGNIPSVPSVASTFAPIVSEVSYLGQPCTVWNEQNSYEPYVLRSVRLQGSQPLTVISFQVSWRDRSGIVRPLLLPPAGSIFAIKCQFLRWDDVEGE